MNFITVHFRKKNRKIFWYPLRKDLTKIMNQYPGKVRKDVYKRQGEALLGYHPCNIGFLTSRRDPAVGQCQAGSLTGAVASERVSEALKVSLIMVGNH